jgi:hypothetical protein
MHVLEYLVIFAVLGLEAHLQEEEGGEAAAQGEGGEEEARVHCDEGMSVGLETEISKVRWSSFLLREEWLDCGCGEEWDGMRMGDWKVSKSGEVET